MDYLIKLIFILLLSAGAYSQTVDRIAVIVNDGVVLESDIQLKIKNFKKEAAISGVRVPSEKDLRDEIIEALIIEELQLQIADKAGIKISDEELNVTVKRVAQQNELTIEEFIQSIEDEGDSYELVRDEIKRSLKINRVQQGRVQNRISITQEELVNFLNTEEAKTQLGPELNVRQILIRTNSQKNIDDVYNEVVDSVDSGKNFIELSENFSEDQNKGDLGWRKITGFPELFQSALENLKIGEVSDVIKSGAGSHILYLNDKRGPAVSFEKEWEVRHILLIPNRVRPDDESEELMISIRERLLAGEDFDQLAAEFSDDPGSKQEGGKLGWAGEGKYTEAFEEVMLRSNLNEVSLPFRSDFGWHILEVTGTRIEDKTNERIADQAFNYLYSRKFEEELESDLQELRAEAFIEIKDY